MDANYEVISIDRWDPTKVGRLFDINGKNQKDFYGTAGLRQQAISRYIAEGKVPSVSNFLKMTQVIGYELTLTSDGPPPRQVTVTPEDLPDRRTSLNAFLDIAAVLGFRATLRRHSQVAAGGHRRPRR